MTVAAVDQALSPEPTPRSRRWGWLPPVVAAAVLAAGAGGYVAGVHSQKATVAVHQGTAVITPYQIGASARGVSYNSPLDIPWKDREGGWHSGERPSCLPSTITSAPVTFAAVKYELNGNGGHLVAWVDCSR